MATPEPPKSAPEGAAEGEPNGPESTLAGASAPASQRASEHTPESDSRRTAEAPKSAPEGASQGAPPNPPQKNKRWRQRLVRVMKWSPVVMLVLGAALWIAAHRLPWLGPMLADGLRAVIGAEAVTAIQDTAYSVQDRFNRWWRKDEAPKAHWEVPATADIREADEVADAGVDAAPQLPPFRPQNVGPVHTSWSAPGDGEWVPVPDAQHPDAETVMYKTLLHSDRNRSWAEVFVVAVDLRRVTLHAVAGWQEPKSFETAGKAYKRTAKIPEAHHRVLLGAFNGGFKTEHGWYGMKIDDVTLVKPRKNACTLAMLKDGSVKIATWQSVEGIEDRMAWFRQAPGCMYEGGEMHPGLRDPSSRAWGATLDGETVIRRSAVGIDPSGETLFVAITNDTTARALADGVKHAGASTVAQMDVNWSYPKFVLYEPRPEGGLKAVSLTKGFEHGEEEYVGKLAMRDFFYLTRKPPEELRP